MLPEGLLSELADPIDEYPTRTARGIAKIENGKNNFEIENEETTLLIIFFLHR